ncbi:glycosyltransferase family 4 protein [Cognaticolwellia mytili]|uniref:glycosyltransferase family 4 protein n=1 Tax=Cognaticolwellia mytili TaxID=1888913 RepID=UPI000A1721A2|nr:glycosyltransferase family 4 protein [Cognaticolwellia mytili]
MKIVYFHQHFSTPQGATGIRSYEMAKALIAQGHDVTIVCGSYDAGSTGLSSPFVKGRRQGIVNRIQVVEFELGYANAQSLSQRAKIFLKFSYQSVKYALTAKYDIIFCTTTPLTAALPGIFARWLRRKYFIFEVRDLWPELPKAMGVIKNPFILAMLSGLEWLAYKSANHHIGLSPGITQGIKRHLKTSQNVSTIPNGCDLDIFTTEQLPWQPAGISDTDFLAIFSGTHGMANDLNNVLNTAKILKEKQVTNIKILLIGQGKLKAQLEKRAQQEDLEHVIFHDPVDKAKLAQLMKRADLGLQVLANIPAFYYGTSPNKFFDYLAAGLPVLNNYPGWVADLINENHCGIAVPPNSPEDFAQALIFLASQPAQLEKMSINAKLLAQTTFDRKLLAQDFVQCFNDVKRVS